ncbi:MAG: hypothetical protein K9M07_04760 [Simkaniaceae bacterium]|nr:hypothetical protein [Simkaniaceae bacterium]MCF7852533.1 hypothetical protein [Simkaniaceae bacterium]
MNFKSAKLYVLLASTFCLLTGVRGYSNEETKQDASKEKEVVRVSDEKRSEDKDTKEDRREETRSSDENE